MNKIGNTATKEGILIIVSIIITAGFISFFMIAKEDDYKISAMVNLTILIVFSIIGIYKTLKSILL